VIVQVADICRQEKRKSDVVARFGGEEFLIANRDILDNGWWRELIVTICGSCFEGCGVTPHLKL
jgi:GGDEF domain-containing protein